MTASAGFISRSHKAIAPFVLHRSETLADAAERVEAGARAHAGGIDLVEQMQQGTNVEQVVDISRITALREVSVHDGVLRIGAGATHHTIERHPLILEHRPDLAEAWSTVGNVRIRRTGTVGGNLMAFDKNYDAAPILAAAGANVVTLSSDGEATVAVEHRPDDRLLVRIEIPIDGRLLFERTLKPAVTVAVGKRIAIGCAYPQPVVIERGDNLSELPEPLDDADASSQYRRRMIDVVIRRLEGRLS